MTRTIAAVKIALAFAAPHLPANERAEIAAHVREQAIENRHDPLTVIAIVHTESRWQMGTIGRRGDEEYVGLGQIRLRNFESCRPITHPTCEETRSLLRFSWSWNLRMVSQYVRLWQDTCKRQVGSSLAVHWLQGYKGFDAVNGTVCGHKKVRGKWRAQRVPDQVKEVLAYRRTLISKL